MSVVVDSVAGLEKACLRTAGVCGYLGGEEVIFVSREAVFQPPKAIRGGIPVCWPQFNDMGPLSSHGFARNTKFTVKELSESRVVMQLTSADVSVEGFPSGWTLSMTVAVSDESGGTLKQASVKRLAVTCCAGALRQRSRAVAVSGGDQAPRRLWQCSPAMRASRDQRPALLRPQPSLPRRLTCTAWMAVGGSQDLQTTQALHTYYRVSAVGSVSVRGLQGTPYLNNLAGRSEAPGAAEAVTFAEEVDRIYINTGRELVLCDGGAGREVVITKEGFEDVVVWNPWVDKAKKLSDFGDEEFKCMVCIEPANAAKYVAGEPVVVKAGETWTASQSIHVRQL